MIDSKPRFVSIASAHDQTEAIRIKMLLNRAEIPYTVRGERMHVLYGPALGPVEFLVTAEFFSGAESEILALFDVNMDVPAACPACNTLIEGKILDCPACGLFLG